MFSVKKNFLISLKIFVFFLVVVLFCEIGARSFYAIKMHDQKLLFYPYYEVKENLDTKINLGPSGTIYPDQAYPTFQIYTPKQKKKIYVFEDEKVRPYWAQINSLGLRGDELIENKKNLIICLGESSTFGAFLKDEETYPSQLGRLLKEHGTAVLNAGISESILNESIQLFMERLLPLKPQVVIFMGGHNDLVQLIMGGKNQIKFRRNFIFLWDLIRVMSYRQQMKKMLVSRVIDQTEFKQKLEQFKADVIKFNNFLKENKIRFIFVRQSLITEATSEDVGPNVILDVDERIAPYHQELMEEVKKVNLDYVDVSLDEVKDFHTHVHPTRQGASKLAEKIKDFLINKGMIDV